MRDHLRVVKTPEGNDAVVIFKEDQVASVVELPLPGPEWHVIFSGEHRDDSHQLRDFPDGEQSN